jgi:hypothetical protein
MKSPADTTRAVTRPSALCDRLLESAQPGQHLAQLYGRASQDLVRNVCRYFRAGLKRGEGLLAVATLEHSSRFACELRKDPGYQRAVGEGRLLFLDAHATLAQFMDGGQPSWERFDARVGGALQDLEARVSRAGLRVYGEMVGILWSAGRVDAALRLEELWNLQLERHAASLFCAYPIDLFDPSSVTDGVHSVVCAHTHLVPGSVDREAALERAMMDLLGAIDADPTPAPVCLPKAEAMALDLRRRFPDRAGEILSRAEAYGYAPA